MSFDQKLNLNTDQKIFYSRKTELSASEKHMLENALKYARQVNEMPTSLYGWIFPILKHVHVEFQPLTHYGLATIEDQSSLQKVACFCSEFSNMNF